MLCTQCQAFCPDPSATNSIAQSTPIVPQTFPADQVQHDIVGLAVNIPIRAASNIEYEFVFDRAHYQLNQTSDWDVLVYLDGTTLIDTFVLTRGQATGTAEEKQSFQRSGVYPVAAATSRNIKISLKSHVPSLGDGHIVIDGGRLIVKTADVN